MGTVPFGQDGSGGSTTLHTDSVLSHYDNINPTCPLSTVDVFVIHETVPHTTFADGRTRTTVEVSRCLSLLLRVTRCREYHRKWLVTKSWFVLDLKLHQCRQKFNQCVASHRDKFPIGVMLT